MKKIRDKLKSKKGAYSILATILILIMVTIMTGYLDILKQKWALNEVQTVMDSAGINTLQNQVNNKALRAEILSLDTDTTDVKTDDYFNEEAKKFTAAKQQKYKSDMELYYKSEIEKQIKADSRITEYDVERVVVKFSYDKWGLGETSHKLPQVSVEAVVRMKVKQSGMFDHFDGIQSTVYSARNNATFNVSYEGKAEDGNVELIVQNITRLVYR